MSYPDKRQHGTADFPAVSQAFSCVGLFPQVTGAPQLLPQWVKHTGTSTTNTVVYLDGSSTTRTALLKPGEYLPTTVNGVTSSSDAIRLGTNTDGLVPNAGAAGTNGTNGAPGPNWISANSFAHVTGTSYAAIAGELVLCNTGAAVTVTLPSAVGIAGQRVRLQDATGTAASHNITPAVVGGQTIQGTTPVAISANNGGQTYVSDGANWVYG